MNTTLYINIGRRNFTDFYEACQRFMENHSCTDIDPTFFKKVKDIRIHYNGFGEDKESRDLVQMTLPAFETFAALVDAATSSIELRNAAQTLKPEQLHKFLNAAYTMEDIWHDIRLEAKLSLQRELDLSIVGARL